MKLLICVLVLKVVFGIPAIIDRSVTLDDPINEDHVNEIIPPKWPSDDMTGAEVANMDPKSWPWKYPYPVSDQLPRRLDYFARRLPYESQARQIKSSKRQLKTRRLSENFKSRNEPEEDIQLRSSGLFSIPLQEQMVGMFNDQVKKSKLAEKRADVSTMDEALAFNIKGKQTKCTLKSEEKEEALSVHQKFRKEEHASNMWLMEWDESLAELAQGLADTCVFKHTNLNFLNGTRVGQNLGAVSGGNHSISRIVQLFVDEKKDYDFKSHQWSGVVGHYLQVVYWQSVKVGCALNHCDNLYVTTTGEKKIMNDAWYWVCDYWPPVTSTKRPFDQGETCSECMVPIWDDEHGVKCVEKTCQECVIDESMPDYDPQCKKSRECQEKSRPDAYSYCSWANKYGWCYPSSPYYNWSKQNCQTTCGLCDLVPMKLETVV